MVTPSKTNSFVEVSLFSKPETNESFLQIFFESDACEANKFWNYYFLDSLQLLYSVCFAFGYENVKQIFQFDEAHQFR